MLSLMIVLLLPSVATRLPDSVRVPILVYHNVQSAREGTGIRDTELTMRPEVFAAQMRYLADHGIHVVTLTALVEALEGRGSLPQPAVVLTFDDGRVNQYTQAFPVLRQFGYPATFFPFTHAIGRNPRYFTWQQLQEMQNAGMTIGSHTNLHVKVSRIHDARQWHEEIVESRRVLQSHLGAPIDFFAYPWGALSPAGDSVVRAAGYRAARAFAGGAWNSNGLRYRLHAMPMTEDMALFRNAVDPTAPVASAVAHSRTSSRPHRRRSPTTPGP